MAMSRPPEEPLALTFTVAEWRLIAAAVTLVKPEQLLGLPRERTRDRLRTIAHRIVTETGRDV